MHMEQPSPHHASILIATHIVLRTITLLILALCGSVALAANGPAVRLKGVDYKDGNVRIQLNAPATWHTAVWRSANKFIVEVPALNGGGRLTTLPVSSGRLQSVRWTQFTPDTIRVVLDLTSADTPVVLSKPPTDLIEIRVEPKQRATERPETHRTRTASGPQTKPATKDPPDDPDANPTDQADPSAPAPPEAQPIGPPAPASPAHVQDITVERSDDGTPLRIVVATDRAIQPNPEWRDNHLVLNLPDTEPGAEHILPVNDEVCVRAYAAREDGHAAVVIDFTHRVPYSVTPIEGGAGFSVNFDLAAAPPPEQPEPAANMKALSGKTIVVDAGHGGVDPGTRGPYVVEKEVCLDLARRLERVLKSNGARVIMTRTDDTLTPLRRRPEIAMEAKADAFISIHCNYAPSSHHGVEIWHRRADSESRRFASSVYRSYLRATGFPARGVKSESQAREGGLAVLKHNTVPCALLELGFVNDPQEGKAMAVPEWRNKAAEAIAAGIARYLEVPS